MTVWTIGIFALPMIALLWLALRGRWHRGAYLGAAVVGATLAAVSWYVGTSPVDYESSDVAIGLSVVTDFAGSYLSAFGSGLTVAGLLAAAFWKK